MATFNADSNTWYHITESGVGFSGSLGSASASDSGAAAVFIHAFNASDPGDSWQILPISNTTFAFRSKLGTARHQLDVNLNPMESDESRTQPRLAPTDLLSKSQQWTIQPWTDGESWKLQNLANGTSYNLDVHSGIGEPLFMSGTTEELPRREGQHWMFSSMSAINDRAFSTSEGVFSPTSVIKVSSSTGFSPTSTTTSASTMPSQSLQASPNPQPASKSTPLGVVVGVPVGVSGVVILLAAFLLCWWRKRRTRKASYQNKPANPERVEAMPTWPKPELDGKPVPDARWLPRARYPSGAGA